jgi:2-polyprenyl-6-methoxyphenol hydroxylase-like FAD-dependent oxidoreductase
MSAIEDAEALSAYLRDATRDSVPEALDHAFRVRYRRASQVQYDSRVEGIHAGPPPPPERLLEIWNYPGALKWEVEQPELVLKKGERPSFTPRV